MSILETKDLTLKLGDRVVLNNLTFNLWEGHIHAIVGPNGAGKSTLAFTVMGLAGYRNFDGDIYYRGESLKPLSIDERARKGITLGWQEPARFEGLTIRSYLEASTRNGNGDRIGFTTEEALNLVGLDPDDYISRAVDKTLSGGERKRIELASLLLMQPKLVLLDEPDSGIDVEALDRIFDCIQILKNAGSTVLLITHSLAVLKQAEHAFLMCHGDIFDEGSIEKISNYFKNKCIPCEHKNMPEENEVL